MIDHKSTIFKVFLVVFLVFLIAMIKIFLFDLRARDIGVDNCDRFVDITSDTTSFTPKKKYYIPALNPGHYS